MRRFVKHFTPRNGESSVEDRINGFAERNKLKIIMIAPLYLNGIYVLFEECEDTE